MTTDLPNPSQGILQHTTESQSQFSSSQRRFQFSIASNPWSWFSQPKHHQSRSLSFDSEPSQPQFNPQLWDGLPNGNITLDLTPDQAKQIDNLQTHWACETNSFPHYRQGVSNADRWQDGHVSQCHCPGHMACDNANCEIITRPATRKTGHEKQFQKGCSCGSPLIHYSCSATATLHQWKGGIHHQHTGQHNHPIPMQVLHLLPHQREEFEHIVCTNIKTNLISGTPG